MRSAAKTGTKHLRSWRIVAEDPPWSQLMYFESLMTLGNGLLGVRGAREEAVPGARERPMTLMAEVYDRPRRPARTPRDYRSTARLAALPNPLFIDFDDGGGWLSDRPRAILSDRRTLDLRRGVLERVVRLRGPDGRITRIASRRLVSQARPHLVAIRYAVTPENYSGPVRLASAIDGAATYPDGVEQVRELSRGRSGGDCWVLVGTRQSGLRIAEAARSRLSCRGRAVVAEASTVDRAGRTGASFRLEARRGAPVVLEKVVAIHNSVREADPLAGAQAEIAAAPGFAELEREHAAAWAGYWADCDVEVRGDRFVQTMARFWVFQLLQAASHNNVRLGLGASIPAKTLSGWGYGGRIFWDTEMYMLPFFSQQYPEIARSLLAYRHDRMGAARRLAVRSGSAGIKFPWESAATGLEECPNWTPLKSAPGRWERWRGGEEQIHVNADVAYGFRRHCLTTGDRALEAGAGLEVLVGTARYWASRVRTVRSGGEVRHEIRRVIGPDEGHQSVDNNLYTNAMAAWNLRAAAELVESLRGSRSGSRGRTLRRLRVGAGEPRRWRGIADGMKLNFDPVTGLYEQFDGYFRHPDQAVKQADVLLALHLLPELRPGEVFRRNFERYAPVTEHGSSLSPCMHALFALELGDGRRALEYALQSCAVDGVYRPGGSDKGLHAAALGGGWSMLVSGFGGVRVMPDCLEVAPRLPAGWRRLAFSVRYRGLRLRFAIEPRRLVIQTDRVGPAVRLRVLGRSLRIGPGRRIEMRLPVGRT